MLSRVAASLHRLGRDLERADHLARSLDHHLTLWLDRGGVPGDPANPDSWGRNRGDDFWVRFLRLCGHDLDQRVSQREALERTIVGTGGPSIYGAVSDARRAAQAVRPSLSSEVYEQVNGLYWRLDESDRRRDLHGLLRQVQLGVNLVDGLIAETMVHDQTWDFLRVGKYLERAANVTRLVTTKLVELAPGAETAQWATVLRCCSAFEAYRWRFSAEVTPERLTGFLLFDQALPRSARYCVGEALAAVARIDGPGARSRPYRLLGQAQALFEYSDQAEVVAAPVGFAGAFGDLAGGIEEALAATYFQPSRHASQDLASPPPAWASQGQQ
ncbi:MAG TPA: alpha-E domain-containing protein [Candidatus Dormibacteraeota bacterium]|jgi:uncharacterized alpha-E superfamily protein|nr:alpha-E domain-containing protein [Candidatus Dormibacteraeota bacterium]